jgi:hypothetical protein
MKKGCHKYFTGYSGLQNKENIGQTPGRGICQIGTSFVTQVSGTFGIHFVLASTSHLGRFEHPVS